MENELEEVKEYLRNAHLFRGTTDIMFNLRKDEGFYYGCAHNRQGYFTSTSLNPIYALICGISRCKDFNEWEHAKPLLMAIKPDKYLDSMREGLERGKEIEILGKIDFKDIIIIDSLEKLLGFHPNATRRAIKLFQENILGEK